MGGPGTQEDLCLTDRARRFCGNASAAAENARALPTLSTDGITRLDNKSPFRTVRVDAGPIAQSGHRQAVCWAGPRLFSQSAREPVDLTVVHHRQFERPATLSGMQPLRPDDTQSWMRLISVNSLASHTPVTARMRQYASPSVWTSLRWR
jgi:hypothetical protein